MEKPSFKKTLLRPSSILWVIGFILIFIIILLSDFDPLIKIIGILLAMVIFFYRAMRLNTIFYLGNRARYKDAQRKKK